MASDRPYMWFGALQKRMSVTQQDRQDRQPIPAGVTKWETYRNGKPVYGGINDPRMGTLDRREPCRTCGCTFNETGQRGRVNECPGHFGHIEVRPILSLQHPIGSRGEPCRVLHGAVAGVAARHPGPSCRVCV